MSLVAALPDRQEVIELELPAGSTVADAISAARIAERYPELAQALPGIWSKRRSRETKLRDGDRVELYRPLVADAKQMRRARVRRKS